MSIAAESVSIDVGEGRGVSALWQAPEGARACLLLAHGAGAGIHHPAMAALADGLAARAIAVLRYQFLYMEQGAKRPDPPKLAYAIVRAAVAEAALLAPELALFAGGRSFGGRMTSQAHARDPLPGLRGLVFFAFPLHPPNKPSHARAEHLSDVHGPMLFLQGTRDALAELDLLQASIAKLGDRATLRLFEHADHSFHVSAKSGRTDAQVRNEMLDIAARWISDRAT